MKTHDVINFWIIAVLFMASPFIVTGAIAHYIGDIGWGLLPLFLMLWMLVVLRLTR